MLAERVFAIPGRPGLRIRTLEDLSAYAGAEGVDLRIDGTEVQVRFSDRQGRILLSGTVRPGRMHDQTCVRSEDIAEQSVSTPT
ncbi:hypothetical protein [Streptomyces sp. NPDC002676]